MSDEIPKVHTISQAKFDCNAVDKAWEKYWAKWLEEPDKENLTAPIKRHFYNAFWIGFDCKNSFRAELEEKYEMAMATLKDSCCCDRMDGGGDCKACWFIKEIGELK